MQDNLEEPSFTVTLTPADMFLLYDSVKTKIQYWTGGNPEEQERLFLLRDELYRGVLEYKYEHIHIDRE
tara:strand:+ start:427 stop:633 length:207 start_codon:yes stop_codon:yes gene_type:complete